jgi:hypothetical protein
MKDRPPACVPAGAWPVSIKGEPSCPCPSSRPLSVPPVGWQRSADHANHDTNSWRLGHDGRALRWGGQPHSCRPPGRDQLSDGPPGKGNEDPTGARFGTGRPWVPFLSGYAKSRRNVQLLSRD